MTVHTKICWNSSDRCMWSSGLQETDTRHRRWINGIMVKLNTSGPWFILQFGQFCHSPLSYSNHNVKFTIRHTMRYPRNRTDRNSGNNDYWSKGNTWKSFIMFSAFDSRSRKMFWSVHDTHSPVVAWMNLGISYGIDCNTLASLTSWKLLMSRELSGSIVTSWRSCVE